MLVKTPPAETIRKPKSRSSRGRRLQKENLQGSDAAGSLPEPRKLNFDDSMAEEPENEPEEKDEDASFLDSDDEPRTPETSNKACQPEKVTKMVEDNLQSEDDDLFAGSFARSKKLTPKRSRASSARKPRRSPAKTSPKEPAACSAAAEAQKLEQEMHQDEIDIRKDEVMKLLDKIRENRLVAILPLDCNARLCCIDLDLLRAPCVHSCTSFPFFRKDRKYFLQILVQEDLLTVKDAYENLNFGDGVSTVMFLAAFLMQIIV